MGGGFYDTDVAERVRATRDDAFTFRGHRPTGTGAPGRRTSGQKARPRPVVAIVAEAVIRIGKKSLRNATLIVIARQFAFEGFFHESGRQRVRNGRLLSCLVRPRAASRQEDYERRREHVRAECERKTYRHTPISFERMRFV